MLNRYSTHDEALEMMKHPKLHISPRNSKLGDIPSFSSLPGNDYLRLKDGRTVADGIIKGTCCICSDCSGLCYAVRYVKLRPSVAKTYAENTILQKNYPSRLGALLDSWLTLHQPKYFRLFVAGDFYAKADTAVILNTVAKHSETQFYAYTKNTGMIEDYKAGHTMPSNITILASEWGSTPICGEYPRFIYDDGTDPALRKLAHCPAVDASGHKTGIKCKQRQRCIYAQPADRIAVYAH